MLFLFIINVVAFVDVCIIDVIIDFFYLIDRFFLRSLELHVLFLLLGICKHDTKI